MKRTFSLMLFAALIIFSTVNAVALTDDDSSLTIEYGGIKNISDGVVLIDLSFIQPKNGEIFTAFSELTVSVKLDGSTKTAEIKLINNDTESYSPYIAICSGGKKPSSISISGMLCCSADPNRILNINTTVYRKSSSSSYQSGVIINQNGYYTEVISDYNKNDILSSELNVHPFSFFGTIIEIRIIAVLTFLVLFCFFMYYFITAQFRQNSILKKMPAVFNSPDENNSAWAISRLYSERRNIQFIFIFRNKFHQNFITYENSIITSETISNETKRQLLSLMYYYMLKPFKPVE